MDGFFYISIIALAEGSIRHCHTPDQHSYYWGIAYVPGYMNAFLLMSLLLDRQPSFKNPDPDKEVTLLVAAFNEEKQSFKR